MSGESRPGPTGPQAFQSIMAAVGRLQEADDARLEAWQDSLNEVDDALWTLVEAMGLEP